MGRGRHKPLTKAKAAEKIRNLLRLAKGTTGPEAETARLRANEFMDRYKITVVLDDGDDNVTLPIDDKPTLMREQLALAVAQTRGCSVGVARAQIVVRGARRAAEDAAKHYRNLIATVEPLSILKGAPEAAQRVYSIIFWTCFAETYSAHMKPLVPRFKASAFPAIPKDFDAAKRHAARVKEEIESLRMAREALAAEINFEASAAEIAERITAKAKDMGVTVGSRVPIPPPWKPKRTFKRRTVIYGLLPPYIARPPTWNRHLDL